MDKVLVYLDNCCFNRPYDDQRSISVYLETQAKLQIQDMVNAGDLLLVWSYMLDFENSENPDEDIREAIANWRLKAARLIMESEEIVHAARKLREKGLGVKDALHVACAISAKAAYFITTDKKLLNKRNNVDIAMVDPIQFVQKMEGYNEN